MDDLFRAGVETANDVVILTSGRARHRDIDSIFTLQTIAELNPRAASRTIMELTDQDSFAFCVPHELDWDVLQPVERRAVVQCGHQCFSNIAQEPLLAQSVFHHGIPSLFVAFVSGGLDTAGADAVHNGTMVSTGLPRAFVGRTFADLFLRLCSEGCQAVPMALYRPERV